MKLITFGQINIKIVYIIVGGISQFIIRLLFSIKHLTILSYYSCIFSIASSLGMSLSFILLILYRNKKNKNLKLNKLNILNINRIEHAYEIIHRRQYKKIRTQKFKYIILSSVLDFIQTLFLNGFSKNVGLNIWIFDILFIYLFSYLILKFKIYKHQYISISVIIFIGIILNIIGLIHNNYSHKKYHRIIIKFICEIIFSLRIVINKYTIEKKFGSSYELCFFQGIITLGLLLIFSLFAIFLNLSNDFKNYFNEFKDKKLKESLIFLSVLIIQFIYNLCIFVTIDKANAFHIMIIIIIGHLAPYFKGLIDSESNMIDIIIIIGLILILFMALIFNEIIILNFCALEQNTRKYISERANYDLYKHIEYDDDDYDNFNEDLGNNNDNNLNYI